jgi:hypothetical protein
MYAELPAEVILFVGLPWDAARTAQPMVLRRGHTLAEEENDRDCHLRKKFPLLKWVLCPYAKLFIAYHDRK